MAKVSDLIDQAFSSRHLDLANQPDPFVFVRAGSFF
jgi:hypothetical protein